MAPDDVTRTYPKIFQGLGVEIGDGWAGLLDELCRQLQDQTDRKGEPQVVASQVKEKMGGLRFYVVDSPLSDRQRDLISDAEARSLKICDVCGTPGSLIKSGYCWCTRCSLHR